MAGRFSTASSAGLVLLLVQGLAVLVYLGVERHRAAGREQPLRYERLAAGQSAPDLTLVRPDGSSRQLSELRGKPVLLHFWATWCPPCREELPSLLALGRDGSIAIVAVALDEDWAAVGAFFGGPVPPEVVQDGSRGSSRLYDVAALPDTYLVGADGALVLRFSGARNWGGDKARELLKRHRDSPGR